MANCESPTGRPRIDRTRFDDVFCYTDTGLYEAFGIRVAFSERSGGVSGRPFDSLNLAAHVGDDPRAVDANRTALLESLGIGLHRDRTTVAEQVHGSRVGLVEMDSAGAGAYAQTIGPARPPIKGTDALITCAPAVPLLMFFADCVPVVLVAKSPRRAVAVVHAGWRGALAGLPGESACALSALASCGVSDLFAYIGPHIGVCCYEIEQQLHAQFSAAFSPIKTAVRNLDLGAAVRASLTRAGLPCMQIASAGVCTRHSVDRLFSYRAEPRTGRHGALAMIAGD